MNAKVGEIQVPHNPESEKSVLGSLLSNMVSVDEISYLKPEHFYFPAHKYIFRAIKELTQEGTKNLDPMIVSNRLRDIGLLHESGGFVALAELDQVWSTSSNVKELVDEIIGNFKRRRLFDITREVSEKSFVFTEDFEDLLERLREQINEIASEFGVTQYVHIDAAMREAYTKLRERSNAQSQITGIPVGFDTLDNMTAGMQRGDLVILAARPSMGKTALALNFASHAALRDKKCVMIFSLEMSKEQVADRFLSTEARVDSNKIRRGNLDTDDFTKISEAFKKFKESEIYINDTAGISISEIFGVCSSLETQLMNRVNLH